MNNIAQLLIGAIAGFTLATIVQLKTTTPPEPPARVPAATPSPEPVKDWKWERKGPLDQPARRL